MPRKLRIAKDRTQPVPTAFQHYLLHGDMDAAAAADPDTDWFELFLFTGRHEDQRSGLSAVWADVRDDLLARWIVERPGTRPFYWWLADAPPWTEAVPSRVRPLVVDHAAVWHLTQPRRRIGGIGTPAFEVFNIVPAFHFGLPTQFVTPFDASYYRGLAVDVRGEPIGVEHRGRAFAGVPIDRADPPRFESEASYLQRHGFLSDSERRRLPVDAFEPIRIACGDDDGPTTA